MADFARIDRLKVTNFQSVEKADLSLGSFTVVVGSSNTGKSALLRALRAVVRNVNSPSAVRVGKTAFTAAVEMGETTVSIERGKSQSTYRVITPQGEEVFTKAGRSVPEEVQATLGLPEPSVEMTFSSQIDPPFLLSETGSTAAKVLGDLTNVSRLHAASKEANRRRLEADRERKFRAQDAESCMQRLKDEYGDLKAHSERVREARTLMDSVRQKAQQAQVLEKVVEELALIDSSETALFARLSEIPVPADIETQSERAGALLGERFAILDVIDTLASLAQQEDTLKAGVKTLELEIENLDEEHEKALAEHGWCPTCGKKVA